MMIDVLRFQHDHINTPTPQHIQGFIPKRLVVIRTKAATRMPRTRNMIRLSDICFIQYAL